MDGGAWWAAVHGVTKSQTRLSDFTFTCHFHALEKEMATHSSILAWRIPGTGEPGGLSSTGLHRVRHDWSDLAAAAAKPEIFVIDDCFLESYIIFISLTPLNDLVKVISKNSFDLAELKQNPNAALGRTNWSYYGYWHLS